MNLTTKVRLNFGRVNKQVFISPKIKYCPKPILEGQFGVLPARMVPSQIVRPDYVGNPNPLYGIYEGTPVKHEKNMIESKLQRLNDRYQVELRRAGHLAAKTLEYTQTQVKAGMTTDDIDKIVHDFIISNNAYPTPIGFMDFPKSVCTSVNEVCCHGIPNLRPLEAGDYLNIDVTLYLDGVHGDSSVMVKIGDINKDIQKLIDVTQMALYESIQICKPGTEFNQIGNICETIAAKHGFVICELFTGHGVGRLLHLPPQILHHYNDYKGRMEPGNVFTIEPIILMRHGEYIMWKDKFTVVSPDNPSAQWEHTILITDNGYQVLTKREHEQI